VCGNAHEDEEEEEVETAREGPGKRERREGAGERAESLSFGRLTSKGSFVA